MLKGEVKTIVKMKQQNFFKILSENITIQGFVGEDEIFKANDLYMGPDDIMQGLEKKLANIRKEK